MQMLDTTAVDAGKLHQQTSLYGKKNNIARTFLQKMQNNMIKNDFFLDL
jgi:hypothetical protein